MKSPSRHFPALSPRDGAAVVVTQPATATSLKKAWKNKYRAQPVVTEEGRFASKKEYADWCALKLQEKLGYISHLERQVKFDLTVNGVKIGTYIADAVFFESKRRVIADSKGVQTPVYKLKKKLMKALYNIEVREI